MYKDSYKINNYQLFWYFNEIVRIFLNYNILIFIYTLYKKYIDWIKYSYIIIF